MSIWDSKNKLGWPHPEG